MTAVTDLAARLRIMAAALVDLSTEERADLEAAAAILEAGERVADAARAAIRFVDGDAPTAVRTTMHRAGDNPWPLRWDS